MREIISECINLEVGKIVSENGELLEIFDKTLSYPSFTIDNVKTSIKTNMGFIFIPRRLISHFMKNFTNNLNEISAKYKGRTGSDHLQGYSALEIGNDHFTTLKAKHSLDEVSTSKYHGSVKRSIVVNENEERLDKIVGLARFTWVIYSVEQFIEDISNYHNRKIPIECQLVSIFYDPDKIVDLPNGYLQVGNLTFKHFNICQGVTSICTYGKINQKFLVKYAKASEGQPNLVEYVKSINSNMVRPEFIAEWQPSAYSIRLCEKRKGAFEIIRHLGNSKLYENIIYIPIYPLPIVYEVNYEDLTIDNSSKEIKNDLCGKCKTPLYDDIYIVCPKKSNVGLGYCATCLHSRFNPDSGNLDYLGKPLYNIEIEVIARVKYPRSLSEVITRLNTCSIVKDIIYQSFQNNYIDVNGSVEVTYLNFSPQMDERETKYIACNSSVGHFVNYIGDHFSNIHSKFPSKSEALKFIKSSCIFHYTKISYK
ncbi:MAG TPA: hypothetical protein VN704_00570 [Verrucomicrobiae bacterium]|nr:hypothetical protein [Verrucomicrobiae bacterium]